MIPMLLRVSIFLIAGRNVIRHDTNDEKKEISLFPGTVYIYIYIYIYIYRGHNIYAGYITL